MSEFSDYCQVLTIINNTTAPKILEFRPLCVSIYFLRGGVTYLDALKTQPTWEGNYFLT